MRKYIKWAAIGTVAILALLLVIGIAFPQDDDQLQTEKGKAAALPLQASITARDMPAVRYSCDETQRILNEDKATPELEDWILLAPVCNKALDGDWDGAAKRLVEVRP